MTVGGVVASSKESMAKMLLGQIAKSGVLITTYRTLYRHLPVPKHFVLTHIPGESQTVLVWRVILTNASRKTSQRCGNTHKYQ